VQAAQWPSAIAGRDARRAPSAGDRLALHRAGLTELDRPAACACQLGPHLPVHESRRTLVAGAAAAPPSRGLPSWRIGAIGMPGSISSIRRRSHDVVAGRCRHRNCPTEMMGNAQPYAAGSRSPAPTWRGPLIAVLEVPLPGGLCCQGRTGLPHGAPCGPSPLRPCSMRHRRGRRRPHRRGRSLRPGRSQRSGNVRLLDGQGSKGYVCDDSLDP
jgi:hypothetical protein